MKNAYVSLVVTDQNVEVSKIQAICSILAGHCKTFEIVVLSNKLEFNGTFEGIGKPISVLRTHQGTKLEDAIYPLLGRAVGDFVILWNLPLGEFSEEILMAMTAGSDNGFDVVLLQPKINSLIERAKWKVLNKFARTFYPIFPLAGVTLSRRSLEHFIAQGSATSNYPELELAELSFPRVSPRLNLKLGIKTPAYKYLNLLVRGTRLGSVIPLVLSFISIGLALFATGYAVIIFIFSGKAPEGWTTLMVVVGLTQACVLGMLSLIWARLDSFARNHGKNRDSTLITRVEI